MGSRETVRGDAVMSILHPVSAFRIRQIQTRAKYLDFGISSNLIEHHELEYSQIYTDEIIMIAPLILREEGFGTCEVLFEGLRAKEIKPEMLNVVMVLGNTDAITMAVEEGIGLAFVSRLAARHSLQAGRCIEIAVEDLTLRRDLFLARNRRYPADRPQIEFWQFLKHCLAETALLAPSERPAETRSEATTPD